MEPAKTQNVQITTILEKVATTSKTTRQPPPITNTLVTNQSKVSATIASTGFRKSMVGGSPQVLRLLPPLKLVAMI
jgi:hypothetical protein